MLKSLFLLIVTLLMAVPGFAESGVTGRAAWRGELVEGVRVRAYRQIVDIARNEMVGISQPTDREGRYTLPLPPGQYVLVAGTDHDTPQPGDYYSYFSGSPVQVPNEGLIHVSFNLIKVPDEPDPIRGTDTGVSGVVSYRDQPLERVYLYVYRDASDGFKGPGYNIVPLEKGRFKLRLPPGDYYLLARKRAKGGRFGPLGIGDHFGYYHANPLHLEAGEVRQVNLEAITRQDVPEEDVDPFRGIEGQVLGPDRQPVSGLYVFAYQDARMTGTPDYFSTPSDSDGRFQLRLPGAGRYYLLAREAFGGPAGEGEYYGKLDSPDHAVELSSDTATEKVVIHVHPNRLP